MASNSDNSPPEDQLPLRKIPGGYGVPFFGAIKDRYNYFYIKGQDEFFRAKIAQHGSTVLRTNMPPGPFIASNPRVVAVLDAASFPVLFDTARVEKRNVLYGTFMPSYAFTGGHRVCAYLDTAEPQHARLKSFFLSILASRKDLFVPLFRSFLAELYANIESDVNDERKQYTADFNALSDEMSFNFVFQLFSDGNRKPTDAGLGSKGPARFDKWLFFQLAPLITLGFPKLLNFLEDLLLHVFPLPRLLVKPDYNKLYEAFLSSASSVLDEAARLGIDRDEACHNLLFMAGFNAYGGMKAWFPTLIKWVASAGEKLHRRLADEIRAVVKAEGGVTFSSLQKMALTKSVVYEALRIEPPVPFQYGKAREDIMVRSHDARFVIKKGEMIFGYQPFATKDARVFNEADRFVGDRFVGESGAKLLKYVLWSNGRETEDPTARNKQCPGRDLVLLMSRLFLVELFLRYDTFTVEAGRVLLGSSVKIKSLTGATTAL